MSLSECTDGNAPCTPAVAAPTAARLDLLFVTRKWAPAMGGMETYSLKLSQELRAFADVTVEALPGHPDGSAPGLGEVLAFGLRVSAGILFGSRHFDIVHIGDVSSWPIAAVARLRYRNARIALSAHGTDVSFPDRRGIAPWAYGLFMRLGARLVGKDSVIANSQATAEKALALGFRSVAVVPLASDIESALDARGT